MCGIAGFFGDIDPRASQSIVREMLEFIAHRGPDEAGFHADERAVLGSVRLSILDLATGQQPMSDESGRYVVVYNGEIYNYRELRAELAGYGHRFRTTSDTEVLLHAWMQWGPDALVRFNGGFAFALYDRTERTLTLARDRFGKRPLFYTVVGGALVFASELKGLLAYPGVVFELDGSQLASIFTLWTPLPDQTGFSRIHQIPHGALLVARESGQALSTWSELDLHPPPFVGSADEAAEATRDLLAHAVRLRLRSDVEVGTYLSGGIDSAITTQLAIAEGARDVHSFSIAFEDAEFDESADQAAVSAYLGTRHTALTIRGGDVARAFPEAVWHAEVPVFRTAFVPMYLLSRLVRDAGIKVVLTGEGADEAFLGYDIFKETLVRSVWAGERDIGKIARLYPYLPHFKQGGAAALGSLFGRFAKEKTPGLFSHELRFHNSLLGLRLLCEPHDGLSDLLAWLDRRREGFLDLDTLERAQWLEFTTLLAGYLLSTQGDRMSLAHGVEARCPFLDPRVVRWAASLPRAFKLGEDGMQEKLVLKHAFAGALPPVVLEKPKRPYRAPDVSSFIGQASADYMDVLLSEAEVRKIGILDSDFVGRFLDKLRAAPQAVSQRDNQVFVLLLSVALLHRYFVQRSYPHTTPSGFSPVQR